MKIGVSSYSFVRYLNEGKMDIFGLIRIVSEMGFDGIEFAGLKLPKDETDTIALATKVKDACAELHLPIISYTIGADFLNPSNGGDWKDEVERLKGELDVAAALGTPCMRHDVTKGPAQSRLSLTDFLQAMPTLVEACRAVTEHAADLGIRTMVENHGFFCQDSQRCAALIDAVGSSNFGSLVDIGNFLCADEDPVLAVTTMAPYAFHVHAKDFHTKPSDADPGKGWFRSRGRNWLRGSIIGHGNVDVAGCLRAITASGYTGFVSIEFEGIEDNRQALEIGLENLRRYIESVA
jgi:sugar phosphate isomerase/epimerase